MLNPRNFSFYVESRLYSDIIGYYIIPTVSSGGFILNVLSLFILCHRKLKNKFYRYLFCKSFCDSLVCLVGISFLNTTCTICHENFFNSYGMLLYRVFIIVCSRSLFAASTLAEIYLSLDRLSNLTNKKYWFTNIRAKYLLLVLLIVPALFTIPFFNLFTIKHSANETYAISFADNVA